MSSTVKESLILYSWLLSELRVVVGERAKEITSPSIIFGDAEGSIGLTFNGKPAHLARSNVLHLMVIASELGSCYSIQRVFRDERIETRFHLSEFDLLDMIFVRTEIDEAMEFIEALIRRVHKRAVKKFGVSVVAPLCEKRFERIRWRQARSNTYVENTNDLSHVVLFDDPYFVVNLPKGQVSWALRDSSVWEKCSFNLILPVVGETAEGGERELDGRAMMLKLGHIGRVRQLGWYAKSLSRLQSPVTSIGIGVERLAMWLFKRTDIADVNLFYRKLDFPEL